MRLERPVLSPDEWGAVKFAVVIYGTTLLYLISTFMFRMGTDYNRMYESGILVILLVLIVGMLQRKAMLGGSEAIRVGVISGFMGGLLYLFQDIYLNRVIGDVPLNGIFLRITVDTSMILISIALAIGILALKKDRRSLSVNVELGAMASLFVGLAIYCAMLLPLFFFLFRFEVEEYLSMATVFSLPALILIGVVHARYGGEDLRVGVIAITGFFASAFMIGPFIIASRAVIDPGGEPPMLLYMLILAILPEMFIFFSVVPAAVAHNFFEKIKRKERYKNKYFKHLGEMKVIGKSPVHRKQGEISEVERYEK